MRTFCNALICDLSRYFCHRAKPNTKPTELWYIANNIQKPIANRYSRCLWSLSSSKIAGLLWAAPRNALPSVRPVAQQEE